MPLQIRERKPKKYNVVKPRTGTTSQEKESLKKTGGTTRRETLQSLSKRSIQNKSDLGGRSGWKAPSHVSNDDTPRIDSTMNKNYEDYFFKINRGHNRGSVRPGKGFKRPIVATDFFK